MWAAVWPWTRALLLLLLFPRPLAQGFLLLPGGSPAALLGLGCVLLLGLFGAALPGTLKGFDQTINLILDESHERVFSSSQGVEQVVLGLYIVRGDNVAAAALDNIFGTGGVIGSDWCYGASCTFGTDDGTGTSIYTNIVIDAGCDGVDEDPGADATPGV
ncbi:N-alpha-acetyltransferase 38, NatC auxiliary subunit [Chelonia mydas]|uniref:U6 snRNA-associated Sm-like protein LSm8 n=1 Tax=Chelonia mydas TaxID=8469 RepID=M7BXW4_CHEMY|nr:N-alpha-acetyltransferase 38, NatC auxiliary subunit [Chelonia mydas]